MGHCGEKGQLIGVHGLLIFCNFTKEFTDIRYFQKNIMLVFKHKINLKKINNLFLGNESYQSISY